MFNDKTIIFIYVYDGYSSIKFQQLIWIHTDKTYNGWHGKGGRSALGEGLQWFNRNIADLPGGGGGGGSAMGGNVCNTTPGSVLQLL